jgi:hypothetical protein
MERARDLIYDMSQDEEEQTTVCRMPVYPFLAIKMTHRKLASKPMGQIPIKRNHNLRELRLPFSMHRIALKCYSVKWRIDVRLLLFTRTV